MNNGGQSTQFSPEYPGLRAETVLSSLVAFRTEPNRAGGSTRAAFQINNHVREGAESD